MSTKQVFILLSDGFPSRAFERKEDADGALEGLRETRRKAGLRHDDCEILAMELETEL